MAAAQPDEAEDARPDNPAARAARITRARDAWKAIVGDSTSVNALIPTIRRLRWSTIVNVPSSSHGAFLDCCNSAIAWAQDAAARNDANEELAAMLLFLAVPLLTLRGDAKKAERRLGRFLNGEITALWTEALDAALRDAAKRSEQASRGGQP